MLLLEPRITTKGLAAELGLSTRTISEWMVKNGIKIEYLNGGNKAPSISGADAEMLRSYAKERLGKRACSLCLEVGHTKTSCLVGVASKRCCKCFLEKPIQEFLRKTDKNERGFRKVSICKSCTSKRHSTNYRESIEKRVPYLINAARARALKRNLEFSIKKEDLVEKYKQQKGLCFYSKRVMSLNTGDDSVSVERKDSSKGYTLENTVLCLWAVNRMKNDLETEFFISLCKDVAAFA